MKSRLLVFSLLFAFGFLLIPTGYWHHHKQNHTEQKQENKAHFDESSCFICDFELFPGQVTLALKLQFKRSNSPVLNATFEGRNAAIPNTTCLRGPPQI